MEMPDGVNHLVMLSDGTAGLVNDESIILAPGAVPFPDYSYSGLYSKDDPTDLVWQWNGSYVHQEDWERYSIQDGKIFAEVNDPYRLEDNALVIYDRGSPVRSFPLSFFLDELSQAPRYGRCFGAVWVRSWELDKTTGKLELETVGDRTFVIDITTGEVLEEGRISLFRIDGVVTFRNGRRLELSGLRNCGEAAFLSRSTRVRRLDGVTDVPLLAGYTAEGWIEGSAGLRTRELTFSSIPFDRIRTMTQVSGAGSEDPIYRVSLADGSIAELAMVPRMWSLCGKNDAGVEITVSPHEMEVLVIAGKDGA